MVLSLKRTRAAFLADRTVMDLIIWQDSMFGRFDNKYQLYAGDYHIRFGQGLVAFGRVFLWAKRAKFAKLFGRMKESVVH